MSHVEKASRFKFSDVRLSPHLCGELPVASISSAQSCNRQKNSKKWANCFPENLPF